MANGTLSRERASAKLPDHRVSLPTDLQYLRASLSNRLDGIKSGIRSLFRSNEDPTPDTKTPLLGWLVKSASVGAAAGIAVTVTHQGASPAGAQTENISRISADDPRFKSQLTGVKSSVTIGSVRQEEGEAPPDNLPANPAAVGDQSEITAVDPNAPKSADVVESAPAPQRTDGTKRAAPSSSAPPPETPALSVAEAPVETGTPNVEQYSDSAIQSRLAELNDYKVFWFSSAESNPDKQKAEDTLKLMIATFEPAPGAIGRAAREARLLLERQNDPRTRGQQQWIHRSNRFEVTMTPNIVNDSDPSTRKSLNLAWHNDRLQVVGNSVKMPISLQVNPNLLRLVNGESPTLNGRKDLTSGRQMGYVFTTTRALTELLQQELSIYQRSKRGSSLSTEELQQHLLSRFDEFLAEAQAVGNADSADSARILYRSMPGFWYADESLQRAIGSN